MTIRRCQLNNINPTFYSIPNYNPKKKEAFPLETLFQFTSTVERKPKGGWKEKEKKSRGPKKIHLLKTKENAREIIEGNKN